MKNIMLLMAALGAMPSVAQETCFGEHNTLEVDLVTGVLKEETSFWDAIIAFDCEGLRLGKILYEDPGWLILGVMVLASVSIHFILLILAQGNNTEMIFRKLLEQGLKITLIVVFYANFLVIFQTTLIWFENISSNIGVASGTQQSAAHSGARLQVIIDVLVSTIASVFKAVWTDFWNTQDLPGDSLWEDIGISVIEGYNKLLGIFRGEWVINLLIAIIYMIGVFIVVALVILKYIYLTVAQFGVYVLAWICIPMAVFTEFSFINSVFYSYLRLAAFVILGKFLMFVIAIPLYALTKNLSDLNSGFLKTEAIGWTSIDNFLTLFVLLALIYVGFGAVAEIAGQITGGSVSTGGGVGGASRSAGRSAGRAVTAAIKKVAAKGAVK